MYCSANYMIGFKIQQHIHGRSWWGSERMRTLPISKAMSSKDRYTQFCWRDRQQSLKCLIMHVEIVLCQCVRRSHEPELPKVGRGGLQGMCGGQSLNGIKVALLLRRQHQRSNREGCGKAEVNGQWAAGGGSPGVTWEPGLYLSPDGPHTWRWASLELQYLGK